jgi:hypothetical protein
MKKEGPMFRNVLAGVHVESKRLLTVNSTDDPFVSKSATMTEPVNDGVLSTIGPRDNPVSHNMLIVYPFGSGADNSTFDVRALGWRKTKNGLWVPSTLCEFNCILSAQVGVAGADVVATERFADTIGSPTVGIGQPFSQSSDVAAGFMEIPVEGHSKVEVLFDLGTATGANALYAFA